ncbi:MAG TPA: SDR family oxidoreductase [Solirubrobacteraceae bacterium]
MTGPTGSSPPFSLDGLLAVVTGARRGIGLAIAEALARSGADVVGVSVSLEREGGEARRRVTAAGRRYWEMPANLGDRDAVRRLLGRLEEIKRPVDILVNNAGTIHRAPAAEHAIDAWDDVLEVNLTAPFILAQAIGAGMAARGSGKIIFIASLLTFQGGINVVAYAASKHAIAGVTKAFANEWAQAGVNVNAVAPGYIETDNTRPLREDPDRAHAILERIPAGRWGRPEDIAGAVVFLASSAADYVNGTVLAVDGGWLGR